MISPFFCTLSVPTGITRSTFCPFEKRSPRGASILHMRRHLLVSTRWTIGSRASQFSPASRNNSVTLPLIGDFRINFSTFSTAISYSICSCSSAICSRSCSATASLYSSSFSSSSSLLTDPMVSKSSLVDASRDFKVAALSAAIFTSTLLSQISLRRLTSSSSNLFSSARILLFFETLSPSL